MGRLYSALGFIGVCCLASPASAQSSFADQPVLSLGVLALLSLLPFAFMATTSFVKISVVLSILRNALGTGQVPSGTIIAGLSVILSLYVMTPVGYEIIEEAGPAAARVDQDAPLEGESFDALMEAVEQGAAPLRRFLDRHAGDEEKALFYDMARQVRPAAQRAEVSADDLLVLLPAFLITELAEAFQIGFLVFVPFLVIDMVVANVLLALGMHMLSPTTVSLPFKLLLFVLVKGWYLLARALVLGYF
ncbi:MAG: type III secretion system export apparatus subunit SctR [Myxococcota bacterium]